MSADHKALEAALGKNLTQDLIGIARLIEAATLVVAGEVVTCRRVQRALRQPESNWRSHLDATVEAMADSLAALMPGGSGVFWTDVLALADSLSSGVALPAHLVRPGAVPAETQRVGGQG